MINVSSYTTALYGKLNTALSSYNVERGVRINADPGVCPWVGVYPGQVSSSPKTLGGGTARWAHDVELMFVVQTASFVDDGSSASDQLETVIQEACSAINADLTLGLTGVRVVGMNREYTYVVYDGDGSGALFMPQALIKVKLEVRSA